MTEAMQPQYSDQPDNYNRRGYTDMAVKIYGGYAPTKYDIRMDSRELHVELSIEDVRRIEEYTGQKLLDEDYILEEINEYYDVRKKNNLTKCCEKREELSAELDNEIRKELKQGIRKRAKLMAGLPINERTTVKRNTKEEEVKRKTKTIAGL